MTPETATLVLESPLGPLTLTAEDGRITRLVWSDGTTAGHATGNDPLLADAQAQLESYFAGRRPDFDLPLAPKGTAFQQRVWRALTAIPYGETRSYGEIAGSVDSVPRAVGGACGANPIPIIIPCHRVLAGGGRLGGFSAAGGVADKRWLLDLEAGSPALPLG